MNCIQYKQKRAVWSARIFTGTGLLLSLLRATRARSHRVAVGCVTVAYLKAHQCEPSGYVTSLYRATGHG